MNSKEDKTKDNQITFDFVNKQNQKEEEKDIAPKAAAKKNNVTKTDIAAKNKLDEMIQILFSLTNMHIDDLNQFKKTYNEYLYRLDEINRELNAMYNKEMMFTNHVEMFRELKLPLGEHRYFKKIAKNIPELREISSIPIYFNDSLNYMLLERSKDKESYMKLTLDETRAYIAEEKALELYGAIRGALNRGSYLEEELLKIFRRVDKLNRDNIVSVKAEEMFTMGDRNYTSFYKPHDSHLANEAIVCSLCRSVAKKDDRGVYKCRGEAFCSHYRDKNLPQFIKIKIPESEILWVIQDMYYELITLPNLFEEITFNILLNKLPKDKYIISLYPGIDREGDIKVISKVTGRTYLIDCKKYRTILTLIKYELSSISTLRKIKTLPENHEFMYVVPGEITKLSNIDYARKDKYFNKLNALIFSEKEVADYILRQEQKYLTEKEV